MKTAHFYWSMLLVATFCLLGCGTPKPQPQPVTDPLAGWRVLLKRDSDKFDVKIKDDYRAYIQNELVPKNYIIDNDNIWFYESGTAQHAVRIEIPLDGTYWEHVLIYDRDNKRIQTVKYVGGHY